MYSVSEAYCEAVDQNIRTDKIRIELLYADLTEHCVLTDEDIEEGTLTISRQCVNHDYFEFGAAYAGELQFQTRTQKTVRAYLVGQYARVIYSLRLADGTFEEVPMGVFQITACEFSKGLRRITAYDCLINLDWELDFEPVANVTPHHMLTFALHSTLAAYLAYELTPITVTLGNTKEEIEAMPNGTLPMSIGDDIQTAREYISTVAELLGCYIEADRAVPNQIWLRQFRPEPVRTVRSRIRFDYSVSNDWNRPRDISTQIRYRDDGSKLAAPYTYSADGDGTFHMTDGYRMVLNNKILNLMGETNAKKAADNLAAELTRINRTEYLPIRFSFLGDPALDTGDMVMCVYNGTQNPTLIGGYVWNYRNAESITAVGGNKVTDISQSPSGLKNEGGAGKSEDTYYRSHSSISATYSDDSKTVMLRQKQYKNGVPVEDQNVLGLTTRWYISNDLNESNRFNSEYWFQVEMYDEDGNLIHSNDDTLGLDYIFHDKTSFWLRSTPTEYGYLKGSAAGSGFNGVDLVFAIQSAPAKWDDALKPTKVLIGYNGYLGYSRELPTYFANDIWKEGDSTSLNDQIKAKYTRPESGIPKSDMASDVQDSLHKADAALQEHQDISGKLDKTGDAGSTTVSFTRASSRTNLTPGEKLSSLFGKIAKWFSDLKTVAFTGSYKDLSDKPAIPDISGKQDKLTAGANITISGNTISAKDTTYTSKEAVPQGTELSLVTTGEKADWNAKTANAGTITGIKMNGVTKGTKGVVDLGTVLTSHQDISGKQDKLSAGTNVTISGNTISAVDKTVKVRSSVTTGADKVSTVKISISDVENGEVVNGYNALSMTNAASCVVSGTSLVQNYSMGVTTWNGTSTSKYSLASYTCELKFSTLPTVYGKLGVSADNAGDDKYTLSYRISTAPTRWNSLAETTRVEIGFVDADGKAATLPTHFAGDIWKRGDKTSLNAQIKSKAETTELAKYLPLAGGKMTGAIDMATNPCDLLVGTHRSISTGGTGTAIAGGAVDAKTSLLTGLKNRKSIVGTYTDANGSWMNLISVRHRNGYGDGVNYGMYLISALTSGGNLIWNKQTAANTWQGERTLLDSANYSSYAAKSSHTHEMIVNNSKLISGSNNAAQWCRLGTLISFENFSTAVISVWSGDGANGLASQNSWFEIHIKDGWQSSQSATSACGVTVYRTRCSTVKVKVIPTAHNTFTVWVYLPWAYWNGNYAVNGRYKTWTSDFKNQPTEPEGTGANTAYYDQAFLTSTVANATTWNGLTDDTATYNSADTWLLVKNGNKIQHRLSYELEVKRATTLTDTGWEALPRASTTPTLNYPGVNYRKYGKMVTVNGGVVFASDQSGPVIGQLPEGCRPVVQEICAVGIDKNTYSTFFINIKSDGTILFSTKTAGFFKKNTMYYINETFFVS